MREQEFELVFFFFKSQQEVEALFLDFKGQSDRGHLGTYSRSYLILGSCICGQEQCVPSLLCQSVVKQIKRKNKEK